jgi:osmoprotectant transport system ATP-binding protein
VIQFESVSKTYRDGTHAVSDLSLIVPSGKITVFVGPSGCGKTTTLRMVNRMLEPTSGRILWDGQPLKSRRRTALRRQMGYVIQSGGLFPHRTVLENIGTVPGLLGWKQSKIRSRGHELLDAVGLERKLGDRYPAQLSGGQQQRVGVARALAADPLVLLMDEPFSAVDPVVRAELHEFFLGLQRELSKTIIVITHDIDEAIKLGDQVAILRVGGSLAQAGTPQEVLEEPADAFVEGFVGKDRGYRALSFVPSSDLELHSVRMVRDEAAVAGEGPVLLVDADATPQGWIDPTRGSHVMRLGAVFDPKVDTLRVALDSALTSPVALAVAVNRETGRYLGVVTADEILAQVADSRAALDDPGVDTHETGTAPGVQNSANAAVAATAGDSPTSDESTPADESKLSDESTPNDTTAESHSDTRAETTVGDTSPPTGPPSVRDAPAESGEDALTSDHRTEGGVSERAAPAGAEPDQEMVEGATTESAPEERVADTDVTGSDEGGPPVGDGELEVPAAEVPAFEVTAGEGPASEGTSEGPAPEDPGPEDPGGREAAAVEGSPSADDQQTLAGDDRVGPDSASDDGSPDESGTR